MKDEQKKSRSTKTRPTNAVDLMRVVSQGATLDARTNYSKAITDTQRIVESNPQEAVQAVMSNSLAVWAVIQQALTAELTREKSLIVDGQLHPLINELAKVQLSLASSVRGVLSAKPTKQSHKAKGKSDDSTIDIASILLTDDPMEQGND